MNQHQLVIKHLAVLESAPAVVAEVEKVVFAAINRKIEKWVRSQNGWEGVFDLDETTFKSPLWEKNDKGEYISAYYQFIAESPEEYNYFLSALLGIVPYRFGICFYAFASWVTGMSGRGQQPVPVWKRYLAEKFPETKLAELGFELQGDSLFLPIHVDAQILADSYSEYNSPNSLDAALEPVDEALKKLDQAHPQIQTLLTAAIAHFAPAVPAAAP